MKTYRILFGILLGIFLLAGANALSSSGAWADGSASATITSGDSIGFNYYFLSAHPPMLVSVKLYDSAGDLVHTFLNASTSDLYYGNSNPVTITPADYENSGIYYLTFYSKDSLSEKASSITLTVIPSSPTNSPPTISPIPNQNVNESSAYNYQVSASDADGDSLVYSLPQAPSWLSINPSSGAISGTSPSVNSDTNYQIIAGVSDGKNPVVTKSYTLTVKNVQAPSNPDTTKPVITILGDNPAIVEVFSNYIDAGATASDNVDGDITSRISRAGSVDANILGTYAITYTVSDNAGNTATATRNVNVVDDVKPTITFSGTIYQNLTIASGNFSLTGHVSDNYKLANVSVLLDGAVYQTDSSGLNNSDYQFNLVSVPDGDHTWSYEACDTSGNCAVSTQVNFAIDTIAPSIQFIPSTPANNSFINSSSITFNVTASDSLSGLGGTTVYLYNSSGLVKNSSSLSSAFTGLSDGVYYLNATSTDNAGNTNSTETRKITVDTAVPLASFVSPLNNSVLDHSYISLNVAASDANLKNITARLYDSSGDYITQATSTFSPLVSTISGLSNGIYYLNATAYDLAGNVGFAKTIRITVNASSTSGSGGSSSKGSSVSVSYGNVFTPSQEQINQTSRNIALETSNALSASDYALWILIAAIVAILAVMAAVVLIRKKNGFKGN